jgi:hypothetical protein
MVNVNEAVQRYRLELRHIWNECFWVDPALRDWDAVRAFRELRLPLFAALIGHPLGLRSVDRVFGSGFSVVPNACFTEGFPGIQVNVSVPSSPSAGIWEPIAGPFTREQAQFTLVDFFDWAPMRYIDLQYYVVLIERLDGHEDRVGQHALVEVAHGDVVWVPPTAG